MKNRTLSLLLAAVLALSVSFIGCGGEVVQEYSLTISSTEGGSVTSPGEPGPYTYDEGKVVNLVAVAEEGYQFARWTGDIGTIADAEDATTRITMNGDYSIAATFAVKQYSLIVRSTEGGSVTTPGEDTYTYDKGEVVNLVAVADEGYQFINWTGDVTSIADVNAASTTITMNGGYSITANFAKEIRDWYDLDAIRDNLDGSYVLMNDLDSNTGGYDDLASLTANGGKGWQPIGSLFVDPFSSGVGGSANPFTGSLDGHGYEMRDVFIGRPDEDGVGLFSSVGGGGAIENLGVVNVEVTGHVCVGGLVGSTLWGSSVSNSYSSGSVTGSDKIGGLVGWNNRGTVSNSYFTGTVTGAGKVGGLVGFNHWGTVSNSYLTGDVSVTGEGVVGGLVGQNWGGTVSNSYYNYDEVLINGENIITIGALFGQDFDKWLANDKILDVNERLSHEDGYYLINNVSDFKQLLAFGQDDSLKFRLKNDLDLGTEANFYIPYLAGEFDGNGYKISNLTLNFDSVSQVGLFGYLASGGEVTQMSIQNANITTGGTDVGSLVGLNDGSVSNSYSSGSVTGGWRVGGLVGMIHVGSVSNSYSTGSVTGRESVGGLVGWHDHSIVSNSCYNYDEVLINGENIITVGALFGEDFDQWLANDKFLDVNERLSKENGYYLINNVTDFKQLLAFGQDDSLKFRLKNDLDLGTEANFYIPYLAGEFDGNGYKISNLTLNFDSVSQVGLFGYLASDGKITQVGIENANIIGDTAGGLVGDSRGTVNNSYSTGSVSGNYQIGGLVGHSRGTVSNSYSTCSVTGQSWSGGLVGANFDGTVGNSYSTGAVTGTGSVGGLVGYNTATVYNSYWDTETSGKASSDAGAGKTTAEMKDVATFTSAGWSIIAVTDADARNTVYVWNIVDGQTYPFLSWQSI